MKRTQLKRRRLPRRGVGRSPQQRFRDDLFRKRGARCVMCDAFPVDPTVVATRPMDFAVLQAAHVLPKSILSAGEKGDAYNGIVLCAFHHQRHDNWVQRVPRDLLPPGILAFAVRTGLEHRLDREYPRGDAS